MIRVQPSKLLASGALVLLASVPLRAETRRSTVDARVAIILSRMTDEEKLGLLTTSMPALSPQARALGAPISAGFNPGVPRLGVPALRESDASLGVANTREMRKGDTATALPSSLATAATFDLDLAYAGGAMIGAEARAKTFNVLLAGGANLTRDPWGGRDFEYLGEDPLLAGTIAGAAIAGVQSNHIVSTVKHFALNPQETGRMVIDARIGLAALHESDLLAFELAIERGRPGAVMCAYNRVNGDYACESETLLTGVLKRGWGYRGWVMSDWGAVHSTEKSAMAGLDQESGVEIDQLFNHAVFFKAPLQTALAAGRVPQTRVDDMVRRILTGMAQSGLLDHPVPTSPQSISFERNAEVSQRVAEAGAVLLKNDRGVLPLEKGARRIVVIGGHADVGVLSGGGSSQVRSIGGAPIERAVTSGDASSFASETWHASSPLRAIRALVPSAQVTFVDGADPVAAATAAKAADDVLVFATAWRTEGEDAGSLSLGSGQDAMIAAVAAANPRTVVVLETGGPVLMPWLPHVAAVLEAWYPGQRGGEAIARIVFGEVNPSGRLPMTFPVAPEQVPRPQPGGIDQLRARDAAEAMKQPPRPVRRFAIDYTEGADVGYRWYALRGEKPLFPFGYGLSYTTFRQSGLTIWGARRPVATVTVANTGPRDGADVVQIYVRARDGEGRQTWRLAGFKRVMLARGTHRRVSIALERRTFSRWDVTAQSWQQPSGLIVATVGRSASDFVLEARSPAASHHEGGQCPNRAAIAQTAHHTLQTILIRLLAKNERCRFPNRSVGVR